jgi:hypothetical protein
MVDGLLAAFRCRNVQLHIMLDDNFMDEIGYFLVMVYDCHIIALILLHA